jgi:hypothetical protein
MLKHPKPGSSPWIENFLQSREGQAPVSALEEAIGEHLEALEELRGRLRHAPQFVLLSEGRMGLTRDFLQGAYFRYTPSAHDLEHGALRLEGTELALVGALSPSALDLEMRFRLADEDTIHHARLVRLDDAWILPGLGGIFEALQFEFGDDLLVHVRELNGPLFVLGHVSRLERDEGAIRRRNARLEEAAIGILSQEPGAWLSLDGLLKQLIAHYDFRSVLPPDSFGTRLLYQDNRFTVGRAGREVRLSHFQHDDLARAYLSRLSSPAEALSAFFEEYPPENDHDRAKALSTLEALWQDVPRPELGGLTPRLERERADKIVNFVRPGKS